MVTVFNKGNVDSGQVIQIYISKEHLKSDDPKFSLKAFKRVYLKAKEKKTLNFSLCSKDFNSIDSDGKPQLVPGIYNIIAADSAPYVTAVEKGAIVPLSKSIKVL